MLLTNLEQIAALKLEKLCNELENSLILLLESLQDGGLWCFCLETWMWHNQKCCTVAAELVTRLLSNLDGGIESVLVKPVDGIGFQGAAGIGRKD